MTLDWLHIKSVLSNWRVLFSSVENLLQNVSEQKDRLFMSTCLTFTVKIVCIFRYFLITSLTKRLCLTRKIWDCSGPSECDYFKEIFVSIHFSENAAHIWARSSLLWAFLHNSELQMDPLPLNLADLSACMSLPYLAVCQHFSTVMRQSEKSKRWKLSVHGDSDWSSKKN